HFTFPAQEKQVAPWDFAFPHGKGNFPRGISLFPHSKSNFLRGISLFPHRKSNFLRGRASARLSTALNSTARVRIELGPALMASSSSFSPEHRAARNGRYCVRNGGGNGQLGLRAGIELAPNSQLPSDSLGAFVHAGQAVVASLPLSAEKLRVDAFSIVADPQPKLPLAIPDFNFDPARVRVPECIAHRLDCNPVGLVTGERREVTGCAFHQHLKVGTIRAGL